MGCGLRGGCYAIVDPVYQALKSERAPRNLVNLKKMWRFLEAWGHLDGAVLVEVPEADDLVFAMHSIRINQHVDPPVRHLVPIPVILIGNQVLDPDDEGIVIGKMSISNPA